MIALQYKENYTAYHLLQTNKLIQLFFHPLSGVWLPWKSSNSLNGVPQQQPHKLLAAGHPGAYQIGLEAFYMAEIFANVDFKAFDTTVLDVCK